MADPTLVPAGSTRFEQARARLARQLDVEVETITDAQVRAFLAGGPMEAA
jgi:hypothetical protein